MPETHKLDSCGFSEFANVIRVELSLGGKRFIGQGTESRKASTFCLTQKEQKPETEAEMLTLVN